MSHQNSIEIVNWKQALETAEADPAVKIRIAPLTKNEAFSMYVTEIAPGGKVGAHYHREGIEVYEILKGKGTLHTAIPNQENIPVNTKSQHVEAGDFFEINPGTIHQLENTGDGPLVLVFGCPTTHLSTDRIITEDL